MARALQCLFMLSTVVATTSPANAAPITYAFSGTLSQPFNGTTQFTGTFSYDTSTPQSWSTSPGMGTYSSLANPTANPPATLTFNIGNETATSFGTPISTVVSVAHTATYDQFEIDLALNNGNNQTGPNYPGEDSLIVESIKLYNNNLISPGPLTSTNLPPTLNLNSFNGSSTGFLIDGWLANGRYVEVFGTITSLTPLGSTGGSESTVPEPATLLVFLFLSPLLGSLKKHKFSADAPNQVAQ